MRPGGLAFVLGLACWFAACTGTGRAILVRSGEGAAWQTAVGETAALEVRELPAESQSLQLGAGARVLIAVEGWRVPDLSLTPPQKDGLRAFVQGGGRLLLFGYAARLAVDLGFEAERPESEPFRWGFDRRTAIGRARLGLEVVSGRAGAMFDALTAVEGHEHTYLLTGGAPCCVPLCSWTIGEPKSGEVLARLCTELDGTLSPGQAPVLVRWSVGQGEVLACGVQPALEHDDPVVRGNAQKFVRSCLEQLQRGEPGPVVMFPLEPVAVPVPPTLGKTFDRRDLPMQPLLAHWGWQAPVRVADDGGRARSADELLAEVLLPSWTAGADLFELDAVDPARGLPLVWPLRDPLKRPASFLGDAFWPGWSSATFAGLANEAHARGMLLHASLDPLPAGDRAAEMLATLRFLARELADLRRLGAGALDGFTLRQWLRDSSGYGQAMLQDFHPAAALRASGELAPECAGGLRALHADDGAPRGLATAGLDEIWRGGFPADQFPLGVLDARSDRLLPSLGRSEPGGGSYGDWIVTQCNDFVRARQGLGGALWWRANDPATLGVLEAAYVHGVSQEPLRAAVAMRLSATGTGGYRAAAAALLPEVQAGYGAEVAAPAAVTVLQNNWFSLLGSGGALLFDPLGQARFRKGQPLVLSQALLRTRLFGGRPDADAMRSERLDLLGSGTRHEGDYGRTVAVGGPRREDRLVPAVLAFDEQPTWPQRACIELHSSTGYHELEVQGRGVRGAGILVISLDGALLQCVPFAAGRPAETVVVPLHLAKILPRTLQFAVAEGGAVAFDRLRISRVGDVGAEAQVDVPAGSLAQIGERSASSYHAERIELRTLADFPGFLVRIFCDRASRSLQIERTLHLPGYTNLVAHGSGDDEKSLRTPFVLRSNDESLPDLVIAPIQMPRYDRFAMRDGVLSMHSPPEAGGECRFGVLLADRSASESLRANAGPIFHSLDRPHELDLGDRGEATLINDLPVAWTRVVHVRQNARTPYLVRENGWWLWRGAQPAPTGGDLLRVCQLPGDIVQIVGGPAVLARTRPGPGSLHVVALRDPAPTNVLVRVLQPSRLGPPSVVMGADFQAVRVDGKPWAWFAGRTVFLPDVPGDYRIAVSTHAGEVAPHVASTRAPLQQCEYDAQQKVLVLLTGTDPLRPVELPFTAILCGPVPVRIENGEVVAEDSLRHADAAARAAAMAGGVVIRFRSGLTKVHYGE